MYNFPFDTCEYCEDRRRFIAQPYSFSINLLSSIILLGFCVIVKSIPVKITICSYFLFEVFHTFSHAQHISGDIQKYIVHYLAYFMILATLYAILYLSNTKLTDLEFLAIILIVLIDQYSKTTFEMFSTGMLLFSVVILTQYKKLPNEFKNVLQYIFLPGLIILWILLYNETKNCQRMLAWKNLPYHAAIEIIGIVLFTFLAYSFYIWEKSI